jgi:lysophospholipase L1-like esterase
MIIFLGDSFTWGQGLQLSYWIDNGKSIEECNKLMPPDVPSETYDYYTDEFRRKHHFPNLVSKHFNKSYVTKYGNGGTNNDIVEILDSLPNQMDCGGIDFFVIQLTESSRDLPEHYASNKELNLPLTEQIKEIDKWLEEYKEDKIKQIIGKIRLISNAPFFITTWRKDFNHILEKKFKEYLIPLQYNENTYISFEELGEENKHLHLNHQFEDSHDLHLNIDAHKIIASSIINKVENSKKLI